MTYEAPKRFTAVNDITGALIKSKSDNQDAYSKGYDILINGNISKEQPETKFPITIRLSRVDLDNIKNIADRYNLSVQDYIENILKGSIDFHM